jgi:hypothetical protein
MAHYSENNTEQKSLVVRSLSFGFNAFLANGVHIILIVISVVSILALMIIVINSIFGLSPLIKIKTINIQSISLDKIRFMDIGSFLRTLLYPFILLISSSFFYLGLTRIGLHIYDHKPISIDLFANNVFSIFFSCIASLLYWIMVSIGFFLLWTALFVVSPIIFFTFPGQFLLVMLVIASPFFVLIGIFFAVAFNLYLQAIADFGCGPIEALQYSYRLSAGYRWQLLFLYFIYAIITGIMAPLFFITMPLQYLSYAYAYRTLQKEKNMTRPSKFAEQ